MKAATCAVLVVAAVAACAPQGEAPGPDDRAEDRANRTLGAKGVTADQAEWLSRSHRPPAGR